MPATAPEGDDATAALAIEVLDPSAADDADLVARVTALVNLVYAASEEGIWQRDATRTTAAELAGLVRAGEIAVARLDGRVVGAVRIQQLDERAGGFGMLAGDPEHRGIGIGRELIAFAERRCRARGLTAMHLELLVPQTWSHPSKVFLDAWYRRIGYRVVRRTRLDEAYPELARQLATDCDFVVYEKSLTEAPDRAA
jgi:GNAT superfamily N-acetyltransferase